MGFMIACLAFTRVILMIKKPSLQPDDHQVFGVATNLVAHGFILVVFVTAAVILRKIDNLELHLVVVAIFSLVLNVGLPIYYIVSLPNLKKYAWNSLQHHFMVEAMNRLRHFVADIKPSPQVDVIV